MSRINTKKLQDKVVIVTGGANGIGKETVKLFLAEGAKVAIADYNQSAGITLLEECQQAGFKHVRYVQVDVSDIASVEQMVQNVIEAFSTVDILINNAGITQDAMLAKMTVEQWKRVIDVNLNGVFYCTKAVIPHLIEKGAGKIINTSSIVGHAGNIGQTNYAASKAGVIGMTKTWAKELGRKGITVNAVAPGFIETSMALKVPEKVLSNLISQIPLHRLGQPSDIAKAYLFLASDDADYVNGTVLEVNGGLSI
ncbi:3-oxoacyl-ACP reductase FabG [Brevibacillus laterosporus]|uniref:3-oxoacyl-ACP reductase FabG n=1 Tax=Brevibacillus laterosporus TaxID=1465 RepID=UPI00144463AC|nr:3-oxoacyl-ACP reductase FabG [Brevibacillus laterosporus]MCR8936044.1 3-oxoacyl-ACP reductase FabG [Brevibacillus laterosporus]MCZ0838683.1 3-oxoacyl-ACP reductase FabG [Brevibacillus laterosporus]MCZ0843158.1 3-oxoacyl-ACP reductase FabG [Brevibacillus laterosporus]NKQ18782.1 3-oxoacyl-ACP reductase FabG [Brevibacillus laterosporus]WNX29345.1 3-oxoacyl-ACP reductase FabG [Brevibacillus laterosporus]